jgi:hypothetical protein
VSSAARRPLIDVPSSAGVRPGRNAPDAVRRRCAGARRSTPANPSSGMGSGSRWLSDSRAEDVSVYRLGRRPSRGSRPVVGGRDRSERPACLG